MSAAQVIDTLSLPDSEYVRVTLIERDGAAVVDVRLFTKLTEVSGVQTSTGRGVSLSVAALPALIEALGRASKEVERRLMNFEVGHG